MLFDIKIRYYENMLCDKKVVNHIPSTTTSMRKKINQIPKLSEKWNFKIPRIGLSKWKKTQAGYKSFCGKKRHQTMSQIMV